MRSTRWSTAFGMILAVSASTGLAACDDDATSEAASQGGDYTVVPGVDYTTFERAVEGGTTQVHLLTVDLSAPGVRADVLTPGAITQTERPSVMAERAGAVAVVNGDFFNNADDQQVGAPTWAPIGPMIVGGEDLKGAVPDRHRQGPDRPADHQVEGIDDLPGVTPGGLLDNRTVFGITAEGVAAVSELELRGTVYTDTRTLPLAGLNQHAIPENGIGLYTHEWGLEERARAVCGLDDDRDGPCSGSAFEFTVTDGVVTDTKSLADGRPVVTRLLEPDEVVIVARDAATHDLARVTLGDRIYWDYELVSPDGTEFTAALGGSPLVLDGKAVGGLDGDAQEPRTAVGHSEDGTSVYLVVVDGRNDEDRGASLEELAEIMIEAGAVAAVNLDGGGSSVMAAADAGGENLSVKNTPSDGALLGERQVANALAVFGGPSSEADDRNPPDEPEATHAQGELGELEGRWEVVATWPGQASTLTFDGYGNATYATEGSFIDYWTGRVRTELDSTYILDLVPSDSVYEEYGDDLDISPWLFTFHFELDADNRSLTLLGDYAGTQYVRADG